MPRLLLTAAALIALSPAAAVYSADQQPAPAPAAPSVLDFHDLRLSIGGGPGPSHVRDDYTAGTGSAQPSGTYDYKLDRKDAGIIEASYVAGNLGPHGGLVWGGGLRIAGGKLDVSGGGPGYRDRSYSRVGPAAHLDYGYAFNHNLHLEAGGLLGFGLASADWSDRDSAGGVHDKRATGAYGEIGARVGLYGCILRHLVLGGEIELTATRTALTADQDNPGADKLVLRARGAGLLFTAGYRF